MVRISPGSFVPRGLKMELVSLRECLVDGWRYQRATSRKTSIDSATLRDRHEAKVTMAYHRVEKGLALPTPRRPFGATLGPRISGLLEKHPVGYDTSSPYLTYARDALSALDFWNSSGEIDPKVSPLLVNEIAPLPQVTLARFFKSRHSVRHFDQVSTPSEDEVRAAIELARNTPSVCNRQAFRVHLYRERTIIDRLLSIQKGATGFSNQVPWLAVVTVKRALFVGPFERNQRWIDGGLFAMTFVWALHGSGLATCMLNWSLPNHAGDELREQGDVPNDEDVVVLIAIGRPENGLRVARSEKRATDDLARFH